jgi:hypothetical protein
MNSSSANLQLGRGHSSSRARGMDIVFVHQGTYGTDSALPDSRTKIFAFFRSRSDASGPPAHVEGWVTSSGGRCTTSSGRDCDLCIVFQNALACQHRCDASNTLSEFDSAILLSRFLTSRNRLPLEVAPVAEDAHPSTDHLATNPARWRGTAPPRHCKLCNRQAGIRRR